MRIPEAKLPEYLDTIETYLPLGARIIQEMSQEQGKLVTTFRELVGGHNEALGGLAEAIRRNISASEALRKAQEERDHLSSPEHATGLELGLQAELDAIQDPEERRKFRVRKRASLEGELVEMSSQEPEIERRKKEAEDSQLRAVKGIEMKEHALYKRALDLGETEERAVELATKDHLPGIFEVYDFLTIVYGISMEQEVAQRRAKIRYFLTESQNGSAEG